MFCVGADATADEKAGALAPVQVVFDPSSFTAPQQHPKVTESLELQPSDQDVIQDDPGWTSLTYEDLQKRLELQRERATRLQFLRGRRWQQTCRLASF